MWMAASAAHPVLMNMTWIFKYISIIMMRERDRDRNIWDTDGYTMEEGNGYTYNACMQLNSVLQCRYILYWGCTV